MPHKHRRNVKWKVEVLNEELRRGLGTRTITPHNMGDEYNYKKMLSLYNETIKKYPGFSVWLVGVTKDWEQKNILSHRGK